LEMAACVFHCLDIKITKEWLNTCKEYFGYIIKPFQNKKLRDLLNSYKRQSLNDHQVAFKEWGVIQFWVGVLAAIVIGVVEALGHDRQLRRAGLFATEICLRILGAYIFAHLSWFAVVQKKGCLCCLVACCECQPVLLLWGILAVLWGCLSVLGAVLSIASCWLCFIGAIAAAVHAVALTYLGINCLHIWQLVGAEIVPPKIEVKGVEGETVGSAVV